MELKVHVDNSIRTVCGLSIDTTVEEIIRALVYSLKQTGRFILIENFQTTKLTNRRLPRIMTPDEKPIEIILTYLRYLDNDEDIEFHLVRTNEKEPDENEKKFNVLLEIDEQKKILDEQTKKFDQLLQEIQDYEISNSNLVIKSEQNTKELIKRKMLILDLKNNINKKKLNKLETNKEEVDETILNKEIELNLFLNAQNDYYKRKLELVKMNLESLEKDYEQLKEEYNFLINSLPINDESYPAMYDNNSNLKSQIEVDCVESNRLFEINKAQFNYLETSTTNLDDIICNKNKIVQNLQAELQNLIKCENNINNIRLNENIQNIYESTLLDSSSSSECLSDDAQDLNDSISYAHIYKTRDLTPYSSNQRYSRIRRLQKIEKTPANTRKTAFNCDDIYYF